MLQADFGSSLVFLMKHYQKDADGLCCRLEKALSNKYDTIDSVKAGDSIRQSSPLPPVVIVSQHPSSTIDYRELQIGKLVGSGEFAGSFQLTLISFYCFIS